MEYKKIVEKLNMLPHPEGGYYKEEYRSVGIIPNTSLPQFSGDRNFCTSIYFLLTSDNFSGFHRIKQDEIWMFNMSIWLPVNLNIDEKEIPKSTLIHI